MSLRVSLLGPVVIERDGTVIPLPTRQAARLLILLAASPARPVPNADLIAGIWGDNPPATAINTLQVHVSTLRRVIGRDAVVTEPGGYRLVVDPDDVDESVFRREVDRAVAAQRDGHLGAAREAYQRALSLWRGRPFDDVSGADLEARRARLTDLADAAAEELLACRLDLARDPADLATVAADAHALVAAAPLRERRRALLVRALAAAGRPAEAGRAYRSAVTTLRDDLGMDPGPELRAVHAAALRQDPALLPLAWGAVYQVPAALSPLIDREAELVAVHRALLDPDVRLITLVGRPGSGTTRLALAAAERHRDDATGGVLVIERRRDNGAPLSVVVEAALGAPGSAAAVERRGWGPGPALLVVDDAVPPEDAVDLVELLRATPRLTALVTAPRPLGIAGERVVPVAGLPLPTDDAGESAWRAPALALFATRAAEAGAVLGPDDLADVWSLCRRLDGLPLALELVAARAASTPVSDLARSDTLDLIGRRRFDASGRLRSLVDAIDDSLATLDADATSLVRLVAQTPSGATLDLCTRLLGDADRAARSFGRLLESHLAEPIDGTTQPRARLSLPVAARARDVTTAEEEDRLRATVRDYLADLAARPADGVDTDVVLGERATIRAALAWPQPWRDPDQRADVALLHATVCRLREQPTRARSALLAALEQPGTSPQRREALQRALDAVGPGDGA